MKNAKSVQFRLKLALSFIDLKIFLLLFFIINLYRQTSLLADLEGGETMMVSSILNWVWHHTGSPFLVFIPFAVVGDIFLKELIKPFTDF